MFGRKKKKRKLEEEALKSENEKNKSKVDKLVMGTIMGVAIGSVVGMTMAPKSGKETRKMIVQKEEKLRKGIIKRFLDKRARRKKEKHALKELPNEME